MASKKPPKPTVKKKKKEAPMPKVKGAPTQAKPNRQIAKSQEPQESGVEKFMDFVSPNFSKIRKFGKK